MKESSIHIYKDLPRGFHLYSSGLTQKDRERLLRSSDGWEILAGVLLSCQSGEFSALARVPGLLHHDDTFRFWKAATELLGFAGTRATIEGFIAEFSNELDDVGVQYFLTIPLCNSCGLWAVEPLLSIFARAATEEVRYQVQRSVSYLLEEQDGVLWLGPEEEQVFEDAEDPDNIEVRVVVDAAKYSAEVRAVRDDVVARIGSSDIPICEGKSLDLVSIATTLYGRLTKSDNNTGRIYQEKMLFEAFTGMDCRDFYDNEGRLQYLPAAAVMETFLEGDDLDRYKPEQRYFFGHRILG